MSWRTNPGVVAIRTLLRRFGLTPLLQVVLSRGERYEERFERRLAAAIGDGECVWDVGANVGHYTIKFSALVGPMGRVVAFEPSPTNFALLSQTVVGHANVATRQEALGATVGQLPMVQGDDEMGATSTLVAAEGGTSSLTVPVTTGDRLVEAEALLLPSVIKIDTEGFEYEVIQGMSGLLRNGAVRTLGIEVHFGILARRGMAHVPRSIESRLREAGFAVDWVDPSHILAWRQA